MFKGIPYAAPPVGGLRWQPPRPAERWRGVRQRTDFGSPCMQPTGLGPARDLTRMSEDCLTVNVWTPAQRPRGRLPVMVWIHGGGFVVGASTDHPFATDGSALARRAWSSSASTTGSGSLGSWPIPVCRKRLRQARPATMVCSISLPHCGGSRATSRNSAGIPGVSRSSAIPRWSSVFYLLVSPLAKGLFSRAISQSGGLAIYFPTQHLREHWYGLMPAEIEGASLGNDISTLRQLSAQELLDRARTRTDLMFGDTGIEYRPIVDGYVIPDDPETLFDQADFAHVPLLLGTTADEGTVFAMGMPIKTVAAWRDTPDAAFQPTATRSSVSIPPKRMRSYSRPSADSSRTGGLLDRPEPLRVPWQRGRSLSSYTSSPASIPLSCQFPM